ncbi:MAG: T9SS type A sorting domain-containing protein [Bacteroidota bacterium]|nr:T9SS type A sorting domain-containing protein [Bacteroidota bacterium]
MKKLFYLSFLFLIFGNTQAQQLTTVRNTYNVGEAITVRFSGSTSTKDWLGLFTPGIVPASQNNLGWAYTNGTHDAGTSVIQSGEVNFGAGLTTPGAYKVCLLANDGYTLIDSVKFRVVPAVSGLVGDWQFDNPSNLVAATVGNPLVLVGSQAAVSGPTSTDGATRIGVGSHYICTHGIAPNNGIMVNSYSFVFDFKVSDISIWHSLLQTIPENNSDAAVFVNKVGNIGVSTTGYTSQAIKPNTWNRAVVVVDNGYEYSIYINGEKSLNGVVQPADGRFALRPTALLFGDNDGEDNEIDVARVMLYNKALTKDEAISLGGYAQQASALKPFRIQPYIQYVTPTSATIMWESDYAQAGQLNYGISDALGNTVSATVSPSGANTYIHKALLPSLQESTSYYFRAAMNDSTSKAVQKFKTATTNTNTSFKVGIWGDSHNFSPFSSMASYLVNNLRPDFCVTTGDISTNDGNIYSDLQNVFIPVVLGTIGTKVPFYEGFGNHDVWNGNLIRGFVSQPSAYNSDAAAVSGSYAYVYGNSVFITIDWNRYSADLAPNGWLETFLRSDVSKNATFRFIFIHCPPFIERWQGAEQEVVKTNIPLLSKKYGVTAVFSGHMHGYERGVLDGVQYITQGGCSYMDVNEAVGPIIYPHIIVGTNKAGNPPNFNNGLTNHLLTLEITPTTATSKLHYFDASGNYLGIIESVQMTPHSLNALNSPIDLGFSVYPNPTQGIIQITGSEEVEVSVFNLQGVKVFNKLNVLPNSNVDLSKLNKGAYLIKLKAGQKNCAQIIIIQ